MRGRQRGHASTCRNGTFQRLTGKTGPHRLSGGRSEFPCEESTNPQAHVPSSKSLLGCTEMLSLMSLLASGTNPAYRNHVLRVLTQRHRPPCAPSERCQQANACHHPRSHDPRESGPSTSVSRNNHFYFHLSRDTFCLRMLLSEAQKKPEGEPGPKITHTATHVHLLAFGYDSTSNAPKAAPGQSGMCRGEGEAEPGAWQ